MKRFLEKWPGMECRIPGKVAELELQQELSPCVLFSQLPLLQLHLHRERIKICPDLVRGALGWWNCGKFWDFSPSWLSRSLGVHCSKVRSLTLDSWEPELLKVSAGRKRWKSRDSLERGGNSSSEAFNSLPGFPFQLMCELGNATMNQIYEAQCEELGLKKPTAGSSR